MNPRRFAYKKDLLLYCFLDIICVGVGMGVPVFCITLGFFSGWYFVRRLEFCTENMKEYFNRIIRAAVITSLITFGIMVFLWGQFFADVLFFSSRDFSELGIPNILYDPEISFYGWIILMIFISPFLQAMAFIFTAFLTLRAKIGEGGTPKN